MQYVIILNEDGTRKTSYPVDLTTPGLDAVRLQAETENPGAQILVSAEDGALHHALSEKGAYWDGETVRIRPEPEPTKEQLEAKRRQEIEAEYLPRLEAIKSGIMARMAQGDDFSELQASYKVLLAEMTGKLNEGA